MTLVIALNALLVTFVLGTIIALHAWAIRTSRPQQMDMADIGTRAAGRTGRRRRRSAANRLAGALAAR